MIAAGANFVAEPVLRAGAILGEGPCWDDSQSILWWVDIEAGALHHFDPASATDRTFDIGQRVSLVVRRERGGLLLGLHQGLAAFDPQRGTLEMLCSPEAHLPENRFNDGKCDPAGRLWAGTMNLDPTHHRTGALYSFDSRLRETKHLSRVGVSNGLAWSGDARTMYYIDTMSRSVDAFDYDRDRGQIANRRAIFPVPAELGAADGMTIDRDDKLWIAFWGGWCVAQVDPVTGQMLQKIVLPVANATSCTFGGDDLDVLYITTARLGLSDEALAQQPYAGDLFVARPGAQGLPLLAFGG